jgi:DNA polymerase-3 subunit epsilon
MDLFSSLPNSNEFKLNLERDIVFFDIESTGLNVLQDKIIQIALIKYFADGQPPAELELLMHPDMDIPAEAMAIHGITQERIKDEPKFEAFAQEIFDFIGDADLAGYNSDRFDMPMLVEELSRCGLDLDMENRRTIDVQKIFYKMEPRTLKAAYQLYCNESLDDAHDALADVRATVAVFIGQIKRYEGVDYEDGDGFVTKTPIINDIQAIYEFIVDERVVDYTQRLRRNAKGEITFNFGKYMNQSVKEVFKKDRNYYHWILQKDFSSQVKRLVQKIMDEIVTESQRNT